MNKLLSIIVPSYNMEKYLRDGLNSLIVKHNLFMIEVIIVNDGSADKTSQIAHEYSSKYPNVFIVLDKPNGHYGSCINAALKVVRGKYVKIMDADDCFLTENFEALIDILAKIDVDLVLSDYVKRFVSGQIINYRYDLPSGQSLPFMDICASQAIYDILMPAITYKTDILKSISYSQSEGLPYTDLEWCFFPMIAVSTVYYFDKNVYIYAMGREGQTMDPVVYDKSISQRIKVISLMLQKLSAYELTKYAQSFIDKQLEKHAWYIYEFYLKKHIFEDRSCLFSFDRLFKHCAPDSYKKCDEFEYRLHVPYHFVRCWRNDPNKSIPLLVKVYSTILDVLGSIHVKMMKSNPNLAK